MTWFDAHLDLAYLAVCGRDMGAHLDEINGPKAKGAVGPHPPAAITLPSLREGGVLDVLGTIFTETNGTGPEGYPEGDATAAHEVGLRQLRVYHNWVHDSGVRLTHFRDGDGHAPGASDDPAERAYRSKTRTHTDESIRMGILVENADPIRSPDELGWWVERGVVAIGLAWWTPSRYAGGNGTDLGLSDLGREMIKAMDAHHVVHDLSHLSQRATDELLGATDRPVIASHSNPRALLGAMDNPGWQRHLSDETIKEIARRGGVIGLNLCANFLRFLPGETGSPAGPAQSSEKDRPTIEDALALVEHVCDVAGSRAHVGLGSDMDGGFSATQMCAGVEKPADLIKLSTTLRASGWSREEVEGFQRGNWLRFFGGLA